MPNSNTVKLFPVVIIGGFISNLSKCFCGCLFPNSQGREVKRSRPFYFQWDTVWMHNVAEVSMLQEPDSSLGSREWVWNVQCLWNHRKQTPVMAAGKMDCFCLPGPPGSECALRFVSALHSRMAEFLSTCRNNLGVGTVFRKWKIGLRWQRVLFSMLIINQPGWGIKGDSFNPSRPS